MVIIKAIHKISDWLDKIGAYLCLIMLAAMVVITGMQIICRVFFTALTWSEEAARYLLVWSTFVGASCVYKHAGHISVSVVQDLLPKAGKKIIQIVVHLICAVFFALCVYYGGIYAMKMAKQLSPAMRIPMCYMYAVVPVGGALLFWHALDAVLQAFVKKDKEGEAA